MHNAPPHPPCTPYRSTHESRSYIVSKLWLPCEIQLQVLSLIAHGRHLPVNIWWAQENSEGVHLYGSESMSDPESNT